MNDPRRQRFAPYLRRLADLLSLRDWRVEIDDDEPNNRDAIASVEATYGRKRATVWLGPSFLAATPEEQRHTLAHELVHLHIDPFFRIGQDAVPDAVEPAYRRMMEYAVDGLADAIAPLLPLPDEAPSCSS